MLPIDIAATIDSIINEPIKSPKIIADLSMIITDDDYISNW
jgi:hypothetical protein